MTRRPGKRYHQREGRRRAEERVRGRRRPPAAGRRAGETGGRPPEPPTGEQLVRGRFEVRPQGFGLIKLSSAHEVIAGLREARVAAGDFAGARHGDEVVARLLEGRSGRPAARIVRVLERAVQPIVGFYTAGRKTGLVEPEEVRYPFQVVVHSKQALGAKTGEAVVAEITDSGAGIGNLDGRIIEVLGDPEILLVQTRMAIRGHGLPHAFAAETMKETAALEAVVALDAGRVDLRHLPHVTIDDETARDFDDAVAAEKTRNGYRLYVSIADVSYYVAPDSALDREAYLRGTSVYFPNMVIPMLPERLSNDLCSLVPDRDRPAVTAVLDFDRDGRPVGERFLRSLIRSHARLTYTIVKGIIADKDRALGQKYKPLLKGLRWLAELAAQLEKQRFGRGSIGFDIPEAQVILSNQGIDDIAIRTRNVAHKLIEELMLAANEAAARTLAENKAPCLYRIHEPPDPQRLADFEIFTRSLGLELPEDTGSPHWFGKILALVKGTPQEYVVNTLLLRTMKQARYAPGNVGHFGLAASHYTHFTSPIRRYPDLLTHRALIGLINKEPLVNGPRAKALLEAGDFLSGRERAAVEVEREVNDRLRCRFMRDKVGSQFQGVIAGVAPSGFFIDLLDHFVNGMVSVSDLRDDYYHYDDKLHRLLGSRSGRTWQIGELVAVRVKSVDERRRWINFVVAE